MNSNYSLGLNMTSMSLFDSSLLLVTIHPYTNGILSLLLFLSCKRKKMTQQYSYEKKERCSIFFVSVFWPSSEPTKKMALDSIKGQNKKGSAPLLFCREYFNVFTGIKNYRDLLDKQGFIYHKTKDEQDIRSGSSIMSIIHNFFGGLLFREGV